MTSKTKSPALEHTTLSKRIPIRTNVRAGLVSPAH
jgi:hypothetical protein